jgi:hypothetical protein
MLFACEQLQQLNVSVDLPFAKVQLLPIALYQVEHDQLLFGYYNIITSCNTNPGIICSLFLLE